MKRILLIQTASIGDVILATPLIEKINDVLPNYALDILIKRGNQKKLFESHPYINNVLTWNKDSRKYLNLINLLGVIRKNKYDIVINMQRFASTGFLTAFSGAPERIGFDKNPFSFKFTEKVKHIINKNDNDLHEVDRNLILLQKYSTSNDYKIKLYPSILDIDFVSSYKDERYICIAPSSLWFTKQFPEHKWVEFLKKTDQNLKVYLLGSKGDVEMNEEIIFDANHPKAVNLAGKLSLIQSAALMKDAVMNFVNDSAPLHLASAMNAKVTVIYCSTVPAFGFGPKSDDAVIIEEKSNLKCRPCGVHGKSKCPKKHFKCANDIDINELTKRIS